MSQFRVLYTDRGDYSHDFCIERPLYDAIGAKIVDARLDHNAIDWDAYERHLAEADAAICFRMPVDRRALQAAPRLKLAVRSGVGYENFDLAAFAERGIPACNVPDYGSEEVAVQALSQVLALRRQVVVFDRVLRSGHWRGGPGERDMHRLSQQTAGVIGVGRIGAACDVWEREPTQLDHPLLQCDNFIASPHVAGISVEGSIDNRTKQAQEVVRVLSGQPPLNQVTPDE
jgi:phosphoglycerate dehydrogenase-like enzyme